MLKWVLGFVAVVAGPVFAQDYTAFQSPTGNIGCYIVIEEETIARCDIADYTPSFVNDGSCELDYGHAFVVGQFGQSGVACTGDTALDPEAEVLNYGQELYIGGITCWSEKTGMSCANDNGHGFSISKRKQELF